MARQQPGSAPPPSEAAPPAEDVIGLEHVTKHFDDVLAVRDATFGVRRGEFFSVLGPSGCGKTTTLRMIAGFEQPTAGRILLEGRDVSRVPPYRRSVNTVFQQYALFPHLSVDDNVAFGPRSRRMAEDQISQRVGELLGVVRLEEMARRNPAQLSGGQQQRVALARALVNRPSALLLDEPLGALDLQLRQAMQGELKRIQREVGITFVHVTHDQEEALGLSDRIAVMHEGRVEQIGTPEEIYHAPATTFVASFIGSANLLPATVAAVHAGTATVVLVTGERVDLPAGNWGVHAGDRATVVVRPERLRLGAAAAPGAIPVTIQAIAFQGPVIRYTLRTRDGIELVARVGDGQDQTVLDLRPGRELYATWEAGAARLLPAAESGVEQP